MRMKRLRHSRWDAADPQETCNFNASVTAEGFLDFLGVDGTTAGVVDNPSKIGTTITCYTCHNEATYTLDDVTFPSGKVIGGLGPEARCITCHQGRASTRTVNIAIADAGLTDDDTPSADLKFVNSHSTSERHHLAPMHRGDVNTLEKILQGSRCSRATSSVVFDAITSWHQSKS
jgi:hypothetical protein